MSKAKIHTGKTLTRAIVHLLVFGSGFAALIYQVLWMKQLGLLFGNTAYAASATLAGFFAGMAAGSRFWGGRVEKARHPLRTYAGLQGAIAASALLYFVVLNLYYAIYPGVYQSIHSSILLLIIKFILAMVLVFPPAFFMGGTIPVLGHYLVQDRSRLGSTSALLYATNTLGAAAGAFLAGFFLPLWLGYTYTCASAIAITTIIAGSAFLLSRTQALTGGPSTTPESSGSDARPGADARDSKSPAPAKGRRIVSALCFLSGFGMLTLEVLWNRMFAQVLENSVYTYATILVIVLLCLSVGAFISSRLARLSTPPFFMLGLLMLLGALAVTLTPTVFMNVTNSFQIITVRESWGAYIRLVFRSGLLTLGPPALLLGTMFPYLMKTEERYSESTGKSLGRLVTINTIGAILGSLLCGFVFLEYLGMWRTMQMVALLYLGAALLLPLTWKRWGILVRLACGILLGIQLFVLDPRRLPITSVDPDSENETILEIWEGSDCTVSVVENNYGMAIKINSHYSLGSTFALLQQKLQSDIPLLARPDSESLFFLGMGTGITAGSALDEQHQVKRVVACELSANVVKAARKYMTGPYTDGIDFTNGLFTDPRATVLVEDGRHYLLAAQDSFDIINADLFVPFRSGIGSLYTREHFENAKRRLNPNGLFVQWLPLYQLTENEFFIIVRTFLEVFEHASIWRSNFQPGDEVVGLVGHLNGTPLPASSLDSNADRIHAVTGKNHRDLFKLALPLNPQDVLFFYGGNLSESRALFAEYPVNTNDRPLIEYMAPRSFRDQTETILPWFVGPRIVRLIEKIQQQCPPDQDPLLVNRSPANRRLPLAGTAFHWARIYYIAGAEEENRNSWQTFTREYTDQ